MLCKRLNPIRPGASNHGCVGLGAPFQEFQMNTKRVRGIATLSVLATLAGGATLAQAEQVSARVISASPVTESNGSTSYDVSYEYAGRQYTTRTPTPPGSSISIEVGGYGVATTSPVPPQSQFAQGPNSSNGPQNWDNVVPEQGIVVSGRGTPVPVYAPPAPVYVQPAAPVYYPAPAYYPAPVYAYPQPYVYPPIGISLGFGYSRGWGGRWR